MPDINNELNIIPLDDRVRLKRIQTFFENGTWNPVSLMGSGMLAAMVLSSAGVSSARLIVWLALLFVFCAATLFFERYVKRIGLSLQNAKPLYRIRIFLGGVICALYGATAMFLPGLAAGTAQTFVFIITSSLVAVGYMAYATMFSYCLMVNVLAFLPFIAFCIHRYFTEGQQFFLLISLSAILWEIIVTGKALQVSRSAVGEIEARERLNDEMAERKLADEALRVSEEQSQRLATMLRLMCDNVPDMIWAKDLEGRYVFANAALCRRLLNCASTEEPLGKTFDHFMQCERDGHPDDKEWHTLGRFSQDIDRHTLGRDEPTTFEESGNVRGDPVILDFHQARFINTQGEVIGTVGCARDITERKAEEKFVQHLAHYDVLTDLPNRALLTERLSQALAQARRDRAKLAVLFIDLDRLKPVNDTLGHDIGDLLLKEVASLLRGVLTREDDTVARLGGDEFVIILRRLNHEKDVAAVAEKLLQALNQPFSIGSHTIRISASIGIAIFPQHGGAADLLLRNADSAMYCTKHAGRNGYRFFDESMARADGESLPP